jgi:hypothetical protein
MHVTSLTGQPNNLLKLRLHPIALAGPRLAQDEKNPDAPAVKRGAEEEWGR